MELVLEECILLHGDEGNVEASKSRMKASLLGVSSSILHIAIRLHKGSSLRSKEIRWEIDQCLISLPHVMFNGKATLHLIRRLQKQRESKVVRAVKGL